MRQLEAKASNGIIVLTVNQYRELVLQNPRPYDVTTVFTVRSGCDHCESVVSEMSGVQYSYSQAKKDSFFTVFYYS